MVALEISKRYAPTKRKILALLDELEASRTCRQTVYLTPDSMAGPVPEELAGVVRQAGRSETGLVVLLCADRIIAIRPPFPVTSDVRGAGLATSHLVEILDSDFVVGVVLLRLGRFAVAVLEGENLVATKTGSGHVKSRHRAGGSSQRRFERSGERLEREFFDRACATVQAVFTSVDARLDYVILGGERHRLRAFLGRCGYLDALGSKLVDRVLDIDRPGQRALEGIAAEVWKSRVTEFTLAEE